MSIAPINQITPDSPIALAYATPPSPASSPTRAAAIVGFIGLSLIVLGGCFLVPVASPLYDSQIGDLGWNRLQLGLMVMLVLIAFICFGCAALLLFLAIRRLLTIMRG